MSQAYSNAIPRCYVCLRLIYTTTSAVANLRLIWDSNTTGVCLRLVHTSYICDAVGVHDVWFTIHLRATLRPFATVWCTWKLCLADAIHSFKFKQRESIAVKGNAGRRTRSRQYNSLLPNWLGAKNVIVLHVTWDYDVTLELHLQTIFPAASLETARPQ